VVLLYHSIRLYLVPCLIVYAERGCCACLSVICCLTKEFFEFTDKEFPPTSQSIGKTETGFRPGEASNASGSGCCCCTNKSLLEEGGDVQWRRGAEIFESGEGGKRTQLFVGGIDPSDVTQGQLGNCWLLAAIATLADHHGVIEQCFISQQFNQQGKYKLKLYDDAEEKFQTVTVDSYFPCAADSADNPNSGQPLFANPDGNELWVLLLEKSFAKFMGSYGALEGGLPVYAMHVMTGRPCTHWSKRKGNSWTASDVKGITTTVDGKVVPRAGMSRSDMADMSDKQMFESTCKWVKEGNAMGAGSDGTDNTRTEGRGTNGGIVPGHAYSVLDCQEIAGTKLIRLRNPWGTFEWNGSWSNKSSKWNENPAVRKHIEGQYGDQAIAEGAFWMEWTDFLNFFDMLDVCFLDSSLDEIKLDIHEDLGWGGPCYGLMCGCLNYWCCCQGPRILYCNRVCKRDTRQHNAQVGFDDVAEGAFHAQKRARGKETKEKTEKLGSAVVRA